MIFIEEDNDNESFGAEMSNPDESRKLEKTRISNVDLKENFVNFDENERKKYDEILFNLKEKIRKEKLLISKPDPIETKSSNKTLGNSTHKQFHTKNKSELLGYRNQSVSFMGTSAPSQKNHSQLKKYNNSFIWNQSQTKITTAEFNKENGYLQNIVSFNKRIDEGSSVRSEPYIIPALNNPVFSYNFSKIFSTNQQRSNEILFNSSFPNAKSVNRNKKQILVKIMGITNCFGGQQKKKMISSSSVNNLSKKKEL